MFGSALARLVAVVTLAPGARPRVDDLLRRGRLPALDDTPVAGYALLLTERELVVLVEAEDEGAAAAFLRRPPEAWAGPAWAELFEGGARVGRAVLSRGRPGPDDGVLFDLATPGPGNSDGGDVAVAAPGGEN